MTEIPAAAPPPAEPKPNGVARIFGVLFSPNETFASIARRPTWLAPFAVLLLVTIVSGVILAPRVDWAAPAREQMEGRKDIPPERVDQSLRIANSFGKVASYAAPVFLVIFMLIGTAILLLAFRPFGGEGNFLQAWSATLYAYMPSVIKSLIVLTVVFLKGLTAISPMAIVTIVRSNPAFLFDPKDKPMAFALASNFDVFSIWVLVLLIIGFAYVARVSKGKSAAIVISLWFVKVLFSLVGPAFTALRK